MARTKSSAAAKRIAAKGDADLKKGRVLGVTGAASVVSGIGLAAMGSPILGTFIAASGSSQLSKASKAIKQGEAIRSRAQAIDNLVKRGRTGTTVGARNARPASTGDTFERTYTKGAKAGVTETVRKSRRD